VSTSYRIVVGITGGIAAYKAVSVIRDFVLAGHHVDVIATAAALQFVGKSTLEAISRNSVYTGLYDDVAHVKHVALGQQADAIVIAPATANTIAQIAHGAAPDILGNTVLARRCPLIVAPAMHTEMWDNPATQANINTLQLRGIHIVGPASGQLTGADFGVGRMSEPEDIVSYTLSVLAHKTQTQDFIGKKVLITAGGTREPIDPVRFIGNRSSGKQAFALADEAHARGANVTVVAANVEHINHPYAVVHVSSTQELLDKTLQYFDESDVIFMAAAIADYTAKEISPTKIKKDSSPAFSLELIENIDVLSELLKYKKSKQVLVGFAAETADSAEDLLSLGREKLLRKKTDFLFLNQVGWDIGFGQEENSVILLNSQGDIVVEVSGPKRVVASKVLDTLVPLS
jgi:phosphopantothenoylcysteine decarboxylase / phosphopantothenate---cysteine ligase